MGVFAIGLEHDTNRSIGKRRWKRMARDRGSLVRSLNHVGVPTVEKVKEFGFKVDVSIGMDLSSLTINLISANLVEQARHLQ